jgi:hypothetical protein
MNNKIKCLALRQAACCIDIYDGGDDPRENENKIIAEMDKIADSLRNKAKKLENESNRKKGHNYEYWSDWHDVQVEDGVWNLYENFLLLGGSTAIESEALEVVNKLRAESNYARIVCGFEKDMQRTKYYSVIYKPKKIMICQE